MAFYCGKGNNMPGVESSGFQSRGGGDSTPQDIFESELGSKEMLLASD